MTWRAAVYMALVAVVSGFAPGVAAQDTTATTSSRRQHWGVAVGVNPSSAIVMDTYQRKYQQGRGNLSWGVEAL